MLTRSITAALAAAGLLAGCAAEIKPITTPGGRPGFVVSCDGPELDWDTCYNAAAEACDGKYSVLDRYNKSPRSPDSPKRNLVVECRRPHR